MIRYFPLFISGARLRVLLVGGGPIAAAKLETLCASGATVTVVALSLGEGVLGLAARYGCELRREAYAPEMLETYNLVVAATDDPALGARIADDAQQAGIWANIVDDPPNCDFIFPAILRHGPLQIAISSGGVSPVMARLLKQDIEQVLPEHLAESMAFMADHTAVVRARLPDVQRRRFFWERVIRGPVGRMLASERRADAEAWFEEALQHAQEGRGQNVLQCVSIGSFDPDDLTVRMVRCIGKADVVFYEGDRGMWPLLDRYARRDAEKVAVRSTDDPAERVAAWAEKGGAIVYLALASNPACATIREKVEKAARAAGLSFAVLGNA